MNNLTDAEIQAALSGQSPSLLSTVASGANNFAQAQPFRAGSVRVPTQSDILATANGIDQAKQSLANYLFNPTTPAGVSAAASDAIHGVSNGVNAVGGAAINGAGGLLEMLKSLVINPAGEAIAAPAVALHNTVTNDPSVPTGGLIGKLVNRTRNATR